MFKKNSFKNKRQKTILVTGSGGDIGAKIVEMFLSQNCYVIAHYYKRKFSQRRFSFKKNKNIFEIQGDFFDPKSIKDMFIKITEHISRLDVLVNNAGILQNDQLNNMESIFSVNLFSVIRCIEYAKSLLEKSPHPRIINISSVLGLFGSDKAIGYAASKSAVLNITKSYALKLAPITVNCIIPGFIKTKMLYQSPKEFIQRVTKEKPIKRLGTPEDVARAVLFFADEKADFITGSSLIIDGGISLKTF